MVSPDDIAAGIGIAKGLLEVVKNLKDLTKDPKARQQIEQQVRIVHQYVDLAEKTYQLATREAEVTKQEYAAQRKDFEQLQRERDAAIGDLVAVRTELEQLQKSVRLRWPEEMTEVEVAILTWCANQPSDQFYILDAMVTQLQDRWSTTRVRNACDKLLEWQHLEIGGLYDVCIKLTPRGRQSLVDRETTPTVLEP